MKRKLNHRVLSIIMAAALTGTAAPAMATEFTAETVTEDERLSVEAAAEAPAFDTEPELFSAGEAPSEGVPGEDGETPDEPEEAPAFVSQDGNSYEYVSETDCYKLTSGEDAEKVSIPEKLYGRPVNIIGADAFKNCKNMKTFSLEGWGRVVTVEQSAFEGCTNLRSVHLPDGFHLESKAFRKCPKLFLFDGGEGALQVESTFEADTFDADTKVYFALGEYEYSSEMRQLMKELGILLIGEIDSSDRKDYAEGVTYLGESGGTVYAADFDDSRRYAKIDSPYSEPLTVRRRAFYGTGVEEVILSESVDTVEAKAFYGCKKLKRIVIPASVTRIAKDAFKGASGLVIYTTKGSYAQKYAKKYGITCKEYGSEKIAAPKSLTCDRSKNTITLKWSHVFDADKYQIYKYSSKTGKYTRVATVAENQPHTYKTTLIMGETAKFKVRAYSGSGFYTEQYGKFSPELTLRSVPATPKITAVSNEKAGRLTVSWKKPSKDAAGYVLYRSEIGATKEMKKIKTITGGSVTKFTDTKVEAGKRYYYRVRTFRMEGKTRVYSYLCDVVSAKCK